MAASVFRDSPSSSRSGHTEVAQMNITPLVDVMLVLLVIFMVATPMVASKIDLRLPQNIETTQRKEPPRRVALKSMRTATSSLMASHSTARDYRRRCAI